MKRNKTKICIFIALLMILISGIGSYYFQTNKGQIVMKDLRWETESGHQMSAYLLIPPNATKENPAPAVITSHGWYNNREMQDLNYIEYARRGFVTMSIDMYGHGHSEVIEDGTWFLPENNANGMYDAVRLASTLPYVDETRIGVTGHSNGGRASIEAMLLDNEAEEQLIAAGLIVSNDAKYTDELTGYEFNPEGQEYINNYGNRDVGILACKYDEFFHRVVRDDLASPYKHSAPRDYVEQVSAQSFLHFGTDPEGKELREDSIFYEEKVDGEYAKRIVFSLNHIHPWAHFSKRAVNFGVVFFDEALDAPIKLDPNNQIWQYKVGFNTLGLIGFFLLFVNVLIGLSRLNFFKDTVITEAPYIREGRTDSEVGRARIVSVLVTIFSAVFYYTTYALIIENKPDIFKQVGPFYIGLWSAAVGIFLLALLIITSSKSFGKNLGQANGIRMPFKSFVKTILLAILGVGITYSTVFITQYLFKSDFRIWVVAIKAFPFERMIEVAKFVPFYLVFYIINSISINSINYPAEDENKVLNLIKHIIFNILPSVIIVVFVYGIFVLTGYMPHETLNPMIGGRIIGIWLFPVIFFLGLFAVISRIVYEKTSNPYIASIAMALLVTIISSTNTLTLL